MTLHRRTAARAAAALTLALALAACGGDDGADSAASSSSEASSGSSSMPGMDMGSDVEPMTGGELDKAFIAGMVPHHQSASDMAQVVVERGSNPQVKALAQRIIDAQGAEIAQLEGIATERFDFTPTREMGAMTHEMMGMTMTMDMASQIEELRAAPNPDEMFLTMMIPHHASAISMADEERQNGSDPELLELAQKIIDDQAKEIGEMQALLEAGV